MPVNEDTVVRTLLSHRLGLLAYIEAIVRDTHLAEDVFQDVSSLAFQKREQIDDAGADVPDATDQDDPDGDRLNVDRRPLRLPAGTYHITDWRLAVADHTQGDDGTITPMLLTGKPGAPGSYTTVWIGDAFDPTDDGEQTVTARGRFTLTQSTDVYAGFFTSRGGSAIIAHSMSGSTDHSAVFNRPSEPGQAVERFAHRGLNRTYAFAIRVIADAAARIEQDESRAPADRPSVNSPIDTPSESEATDR